MNYFKISEEDHSEENRKTISIMSSVAKMPRLSNKLSSNGGGSVEKNGNGKKIEEVEEVEEWIVEDGTRWFTVLIQLMDN